MKSYTLSFDHYYWSTLISIWSDKLRFAYKKTSQVGDISRLSAPDLLQLLPLLSQRNGDYVSVQVEN